MVFCSSSFSIFVFYVIWTSVPEMKAMEIANNRPLLQVYCNYGRREDKTILVKSRQAVKC